MDQVPRLVTHGYDLRKLWHIEFYVNQKRHRLYNGKLFGLELAPNRSADRDERVRLINALYLALLDRLHAGDVLFEPPARERIPTVKEALDEALLQKLRYPLSATYKRDLVGVHGQLQTWLKAKGKHKDLVGELTGRMLNDFLLRFSTGSTYYRSKRRTLSALIGGLVASGYLPENPVKHTTPLRAKESLHEYYQAEQLDKVLGELRKGNKNLYLACLMSFGCLLRPHIEIRGLLRGEFSTDMSTITLAGNRTKNGRVRKVAVPEYVRSELLKRKVDQLPSECNIFSGTTDTYNQYYFNTAWSRAKRRMLKAGIIRKKQTLYSFRHTAVVQLYMRTRSLHRVKELIGHSSLQVTLTYLRSLGVEEGRVTEVLHPELPKNFNHQVNTQKHEEI